VRWLWLATAVAACDPHFTTHVHVHATADGQPAVGALAVAVTEGSHAARTDASGVATFTHGGFLRNTNYAPVVVFLAGRRPWAGPPMLKARGWFYVTDWDARFEAVLEREAPDAHDVLQATCRDDACTVIVPDAEGLSCMPYLIAVGESVSVHAAKPVSRVTGASSRSYTLAVVPGELWVAATCFAGDASFVLVSSRLRRT
jgi:hypothetical protein